MVVADGSNNRFCIAVASDLPSIFSIMRPTATSGLLHPDVVSRGAPFRAEVVDRALGFATADGMLAF